MITTSFLKNLFSVLRVLTFCFSAHFSFFLLELGFLLLELETVTRNTYNSFFKLYTSSKTKDFMADILPLNLSFKDWNRISTSLWNTACCCLRKGLLHFLHQPATIVYLSNWCQNFLILCQRYPLWSSTLLRLD